MLDVPLHAGLGWALAGGLAAASFVTSFITAAFGIGGGGVLLALLASVLPPAALIPVHGLVQLGSNAGRAAIMARHCDRGVLAVFLSPSSQKTDHFEHGYNVDGPMIVEVSLSCLCCQITVIHL